MRLIAAECGELARQIKGLKGKLLIGNEF